MYKHKKYPVSKRLQTRLAKSYSSVSMDRSGEKPYATYYYNENVINVNPKC